MKPFREGHKIFHEESCINQELPFQIGRFSNRFCSHNEKKRFIFRFRGPFWALLGTPLQPHHHDFYIPSLLHHDASPTMNSNFWPPFQYQILAKNTQKRPFLAVFWGAFLGGLSQGPETPKIGFSMKFWMDMTFFWTRRMIFFFLLEGMQLAHHLHVRVVM